MAYYDALIAAWPQLTPGTTAVKLAQLNALTSPTGVPRKSILTPSSILNAVVFADLASLTALQVAQLTLLLQGGSVDASANTPIRTGIQALFAGKTQTLTNLGALVSAYDTPVMPWWQFAGYPGPFNTNDLVAAGGLT